MELLIVVIYEDFVQTVSDCTEITGSNRRKIKWSNVIYDRMTIPITFVVAVTNPGSSPHTLFSSQIFLFNVTVIGL